MPPVTTLLPHLESDPIDRVRAEERWLDHTRLRRVFAGTGDFRRGIATFDRALVLSAAIAAPAAMTVYGAAGWISFSLLFALTGLAAVERAILKRWLM